MRIAMIGSGYVGLVSGICFADFGHDVICVDQLPERVAALNKGHIPIYEPGLDDLLAQNVKADRLSFSGDLAHAVAQADVIFIAVGTPSRRGDGHADLSYVYDAAKEIGKHLNGFSLVVVKSTVPVGTGDEVDRLIAEANPQADYAVVSNPEFLREGSAIEDFKRPDRIVVGIEDERARDIMQKVYAPLYLNKSPIMFTSRRSAELIKYAANAFLAMKITFINEMADLCENINADVQDVARGIGMDGRIGAKFLHAGPGYGGSCFPKDTLALVKTAQDADAPVRLIETTVGVNDQRKRAMARKVITALGNNVRGKKIAILGLTFKPNTDDMRDAPSLSIIQALQDSGAVIHAHDPMGMENAAALVENVQFEASPYDAAKDAEALVLITEWDSLRALDLHRLAQDMKNPLLVDLRNVYNHEQAAAAGMAYSCIGRTIT